jgi:PAS domain S-box-containing protein
MTKAHIMVVEDERIVAADIQDRLRALGYGVTALVTTGEEAEQVAAETRPDLVLMDIMLKGQMDGVEAAERITGALGIPVVFLTAHADETTLQRAKITAPFGYILKPFDERELHTTVEIALYRHATEAKLKRVERWLAAVVESIGDAVVATDKWGLITFMNNVAGTLTAWKPEDVPGKPMTEVFPLLDELNQQPIESPVSRVVTEGAILQGRNHTLLMAKDGSTSPVEYTAAPIRDDQSNITGIVWVFRNLKPRREADAEHTQLVGQIQAALAEVQAARDLLPVCPACTKMRSDPEYVRKLEAYLRAHPEGQSAQALCPECANPSTESVPKPGRGGKGDK